MATHDNQSGRQPVQISFINCFDATLFSQAIDLNRSEEGTLLRLLENLEAYGVLLRPTAPENVGRLGLADVLAHLRRTVGDHIIEAALMGAEQPPAASRPHCHYAHLALYGQRHRRDRPIGIAQFWPALGSRCAPEGDPSRERRQPAFGAGHPGTL